MTTKNTAQKISSIAALFLLATAMLTQSVTAFAAAFDSLQGYGVDTIAGYSTLLRSSKTYPNRDITFEVTKPDSALVSISAKTDLSGVASLTLYDYHTRKAGQYSVAARFSDSAVTGITTNFRVYPDEVSVTKSSVTAGSGIAKAGGEDAVNVEVTLLDQYANPFEGHLVNLVSSRAVDSVVAEDGSPITDENGSVTFKVSSPETGVSVYSAIDATSGIVLSTRAQVGYMGGAGSIPDAGGDLSLYIPVAKAADAGPLNHFEIADLPVSIQPGANVSFRVTAQDGSNITVQNYTGSIHFSVEGSSSGNVTLPEDYTFKAEDLGTHLFSLGLSFTTAGTYKLVVTDTDNTLIKGEKSVTAGSGGGSTQQTQGSEKPTLTMPAEGTYSENVQTVSGSAAAGTTVKIYDNDQEIGSVQAGSDGKFSYQTAAMADGIHSIYVVSLDSSQQVKGTSYTIEITIDTTAPAVDEITFDPTSGIVPGTIITLTVKSDENLPQAAIIFNGDITNMNPSQGQPGTYIAQITAPQNAGAYPVDVVLYDQVGNEGTYTAQATITVSAEGGAVTTQESQGSTQETQQPVAPENQPPSQVFGLIAYGSDTKVTLVWEAANDDVNVNHYRVFYGLDPANLDKVVDTKSAATTWYVPALENGKEYYFSVAAVDDLGVESVNKSEVVSGIPFALEVGAELPDRSSEVLGLHGAAIEGIVPPEMTKNGPEVLWLLAGTGIFSGLARKFQKRRARR
jgi:hypothetical protein